MGAHRMHTRSITDMSSAWHRRRLDTRMEFYHHMTHNASWSKPYQRNAIIHSCWCNAMLLILSCAYAVQWCIDRHSALIRAVHWLAHCIDRRVTQWYSCNRSRHIQPIPLGVTFSKAQSSKLEGLFCHVWVKRDVRALSFELGNSIRKCDRKWDWRYMLCNDALTRMQSTVFACKRDAFRAIIQGIYTCSPNQTRRSIHTGQPCPLS